MDGLNAGRANAAGSNVKASLYHRPVAFPCTFWASGGTNSGRGSARAGRHNEVVYTAVVSASRLNVGAGFSRPWAT